MVPERLAAAVDTALDRAIVPGNSRIGLAVRRRLHWPADPPAGALRGRTALVTGASSGLGKATAAGLARLGATVHLLSRDPERLAAAREEILREVPGATVHLEVCDLANLGGLHRFAAEFAARVPDLHVLVHDAGVLPHRRTETTEGNELTLATHVLGPFLLTALLRDPLRTGGPGRVVIVSSSGMYGQPLRTDDAQYTRGRYGGLSAYARTKRMQVVLAEQWAERLRPDGVVVHAAHPGWADTPGLASWLPWFRRLTLPILRTPPEGADTVVWLGAAEEPGRTGGQFWHDRRPRPTHYTARTHESAERRRELWSLCERLTDAHELSS